MRKTRKKMLASAAAALVLPIANAADAPDVKEGLWSIHTQTIDNPGNKKTEGTYTLCRNHAYDLSVRAKTKSVKGCTTVSESSQGGKYSSTTHCAVGSTVIDSKGTTTFMGDTATHTESHSTYTPAMAGVSETTLIQDQKYVGSCPAGALPGDRTDANGKVTHLGKQ
jgi:hypothetical protein